MDASAPIAHAADAPPTAAPVSDSRRIEPIDAVRGFALLGIFLVNMNLFAAPLGELMHFTPPQGMSAADTAAYYFNRVFCESRFYPLFSMLFGMGMVLQMNSVEAARPGGFAPLYIRRLLVLALFGLSHIVLLWYGDILLIYAVIGTALLLMRRLSATTLLTIAAVIVGVLVMATVGLSVLFAGLAPQADHSPAPAPAAVATEAPAAAPPAPEAAAPATPPDAQGAAPAPSEPAPAAPAAAEPTTPLGRLFRDLAAGNAQGPKSAAWMQHETEAFRDGGFASAAAFRVFLYVSVLIFMIFGFGWHVLAMFLVGAALAKMGVMNPGGRPARRRLAALGLGIGLPTSILFAVAPQVLPQTAATAAAGGLTYIAATLLPLGYFGALFLLAESGRATWLTRPLAAAGRMALSVYIAETIVATFIMYHWGLAMFGEVSRAERVGLALAIYPVLALLSVLWLRRFRFGPLEWLWRSATYARPQPLLRAP